MDNDELSVVTLQRQPEDSVSRKSKKARRTLILDSVSSLCEACHVVADAIRDSSKELADAIISKNKSPDYDTWGLLEEIGVREEVMEDAFVFLSKNPSILESLFKCPVDRRRNILMKFMNQDKVG